MIQKPPSASRLQQTYVRTVVIDAIGFSLPTPQWNRTGTGKEEEAQDPPPQVGGHSGCERGL